MENLSLQYLIDNYSGDVYNGIEYCKSLYSEYPSKPSKPQLPKKDTAQDAKEYADKMVIYESEMKDYEKLREAYYNLYNSVNEIIEQFIKWASSFDDLVPDKQKDKVWSKAWADGHSSGYSEVYGCLCGLVDLFIE